MSFRLKYLLAASAMLLPGSVADAQIPVEVFAGHKKATLDIMFFKYFKDKTGGNTRFLFFNRNRASLDYAMTSTSNLPQFGFTEAVSYNHPKLRGLAPVMVGQVFGSGFFPKAGIQLAYIKKEITLFSWLVSETRRDPTLDFFFLGRYTPRLTEKANLFCQMELLNAFPTSAQKSFAFTQRVRLGSKLKAFQFGVAADFSATGRKDYKTANNIGGFLRYEY